MLEKAYQITGLQIFPNQGFRYKPEPTWNIKKYKFLCYLFLFVLYCIFCSYFNSIFAEGTATPTPTIQSTIIPGSTPTPTHIDIPPPEVITGDATNVTSTSATLNGTANSSLGLPVNAWFEYGTTSESYNNMSSRQTLDGDSVVSIAVSGLMPETTYYYRIAAEHGGIWIDEVFVPVARADGSEKSFTTLEATIPPITTPTVAPTPECNVETMSISPNRLRLKRKQRGEVVVTLGSNSCIPEGKNVTVKINKIGSKRVSITPTDQKTDENGEARFIITARNRDGNARVVFKADSLEKSFFVKVRKSND